MEFGIQRPYTTRRGRETTIGDYTLNIACPYRITCAGAIVLGRDTYDWSARGKGASYLDDEPDTPPALRNKHFFAMLKDSPPIVTSIMTDEYGGFRFAMTNGVALDVFPADALPDELWRIFPLGGANAPSLFIVTGAGISAAGKEARH